MTERKKKNYLQAVGRVQCEGCDVDTLLSTRCTIQANQMSLEARGFFLDTTSHFDRQGIISLERIEIGYRKTFRIREIKDKLVVAFST